MKKQKNNQKQSQMAVLLAALLAVVGFSLYHQSDDAAEVIEVVRHAAAQTTVPAPAPEPAPTPTEPAPAEDPLAEPAFIDPYADPFWSDSSDSDISVEDPLVDSMAVTEGTSLSYTDPESGVTLTLETSNTGKKTLTASADPVTKVVTQVDMSFEAGSTASATVTIKGLAASTEYHLYKDSYLDHTPFVSDALGAYTFTQDTSSNHYVWVQDQPGTISIKDAGANGAPCAIGPTNSGTWDVASSTCTLTTNLTEAAQIDCRDERS